MLQLTVQQADEIGGKLRRDDQRRVVLAGVYAVQGGLLILQKDPAHLVVGLQAVHHQ